MYDYAVAAHFWTLDEPWLPAEVALIPGIFLSILNQLAFRCNNRLQNLKPMTLGNISIQVDAATVCCVWSSLVFVHFVLFCASSSSLTRWKDAILYKSLSIESGIVLSMSFSKYQLM